jgi:hypothetical protein
VAHLRFSPKRSERDRRPSRCARVADCGKATRVPNGGKAGWETATRAEATACGVSRRRRRDERFHSDGGACPTRVVASRVAARRCAMFHRIGEVSRE